MSKRSGGRQRNMGGVLFSLCPTLDDAPPQHPPSCRWVPWWQRRFTPAQPSQAKLHCHHHHTFSSSGAPLSKESQPWALPRKVWCNYYRHFSTLWQNFSRTKFLRTKILLPSARHLEERPTVGEPVSQAGKQLVKQSVGQAGRQTGRQKHTVWLFCSCRLRLQTLGNPLYAGTLSGRVVEHPADGSPSACSIPGRRFGDRRLSRSIELEPLLCSTLVQILLTTNF